MAVVPGWEAVEVINGPQIPTDELKRNWFYEVAEQEVRDAIPPQLSDSTLIRMDDVRTLMITCWLRGRTWQSAHNGRGDSHG